jgi:hypothetical protein
MKTLAACGLFVFFASGLLAQRHATGNSVGTNAGFGNVVFPGGRPTVNVPFTQVTQSPSFVNSLGVVAGRPAFNGTVRRNGNSGGVVYVPYSYPVVYPGGGYYGGYYGDPGTAGVPQQQPQNITIIYPPSQPMPMMVGPAGQMQAPPPNAQVREYMPPDQTAVDTAQVQPDYYLLAFKDHSIYSAVGYWVDGDTLHYITTGNVHNQVSLSLIDRDLTMQLNKGRGVQVNLPASR